MKTEIQIGQHFPRSASFGATAKITRPETSDASCAGHISCFPPSPLQVGASIEVATMELRDNSLLRGTRASPVGGKGERGGAYSPQLLKVGPVCVEAHATCLASDNDETTSTNVAGDDSGLRRQQAPATPPTQVGGEDTLIRWGIGHIILTAHE